MQNTSHVNVVATQHAAQVEIRGAAHSEMIPCVICTRSIKRYRDTRPYGTSRAHKTCIRDVERAFLPSKRQHTAVAAVDGDDSYETSNLSLIWQSPAPLSYRNDVVAAPFVNQLLSSLPIELPVNPLLELDTATTWEHYDYALFRADDESRLFAAQMLQIPRRASIPINGNVKQVDLEQVVTYMNELSATWKKIILNRMSRLGIATEGMHIVTPKLLIATTGDGLQAIHWDQYEGVQSLLNRVSCILYCSTGARSTAMPRFPACAMQSNSSDQKKACAKFLEDIWYHSVDVFSGDFMCFKQTTPHYGVENNSIESRVALFSIFSESDDKGQDDSQLFRWLYVMEAFDETSPEYAQALLAARHFRPLQTRYSGAFLIRAHKCLRLYGLYNEYYQIDQPACKKSKH